MAKKMEARIDKLEKDVGEILGMKQQIANLAAAIASIAQQLERIESKINPNPNHDTPTTAQLHNETQQPTSQPETQNTTTSKITQETQEPNRERFPRKLELPVFYGDDPEAWIFCAERYFSINRSTEEEKLEAVLVCFEGEALAWLRFEEREVPFKTWFKLKEQMLLRFADLRAGNLLNKLFAVKQEGTVAEYRARFEFLATTVGRLEEATLTAVFVNGLEENIKAELLVMNPVGLRETIEVAARIEIKDLILAQASFR